MAKLERRGESRRLRVAVCRVPMQRRGSASGRLVGPLRISVHFQLNGRVPSGLWKGSVTSNKVKITTRYRLCVNALAV